MIDGKSYDFTPADNSAAAVAASINARYGNLVHATAVNVGSADAPDWRVSLQNATLGPQTLDIQRGATSLQTQQQPPGALAAYVVNNSGVSASSNTRAVAVSRGVTVNLLGTGTADLTVTRSSTALGSALSAFADSYNAVVAELATQHGQSAGALQGQSIVSALSRSLSGLATYASDTGGVSNLHDLGLDLGSDGKLTFNQFKFMSADLSVPFGVTAFLGSQSDGGFLQSAATVVSSLLDTNSGLLKNAESEVKSQIGSLQSRISESQDQVDQLQQHLQTQMAAADAMIASMQQQYNYMSTMFQAMQTANQAYAKG